MMSFRAEYYTALFKLDGPCKHRPTGRAALYTGCMNLDTVKAKFEKIHNLPGGPILKQQCTNIRVTGRVVT